MAAACTDRRFLNADSIDDDPVPVVPFQPADRAADELAVLESRHDRDLCRSERQLPETCTTQERTSFTLQEASDVPPQNTQTSRVSHELSKETIVNASP